MDVARELQLSSQFTTLNLKYYTISISTTSGTNSSYTLTATAKEPLATQETTCKQIKLSVNTTNMETKEPAECW
jgi:Tfp pilus assembly protein PilE